MAIAKSELVEVDAAGPLSQEPATGYGPGRGRQTDAAPRPAHPRVVIGIPAYNEEVAIGSIVLRCQKHADTVIVLDDGSSDRTAETARAAGARVISHIRNEGKGAGIRDAFLYARNHGADILVLIDGDGQHDPDDIPLLVRPLVEKRAEVVNGSRFMGPAGHNVPKYRRIGQEVLTAVTNMGTRRKITDTQSGFRAFAKESFGCFMFRQNGMAIESEMLMDAAGANLAILEVPIGVRYDVEGSTYDPVTHGFSVLNSLIGLVSRRRPILFFCLPGAAMLAAGAVSTFLLLSAFDTTRSLDVAYGIGALLFVILGMILVSTGLTLAAIQDAMARA